MPQFTPAPREEVFERSDTAEHVFKAGRCGPGVIEVWRGDMDENARAYTALTTEYGWYIDTLIPREYGNYAILMPITEVDRE